jgi:hypothetical protein
MLGDYFYHSTIKKSVAIFGTLFNNITVRRVGNSNEVAQNTKVPLAYGPRSKFLERIRSQKDFDDPKVAIKLPRMSFELSFISVDTASKLNPLNKIVQRDSGEPTSVTTFRQSVPYVLGFTLSVYGKNQDDVLQIVEQIVPYFSPEYTVTVKDMEYDGSRTDVPVILAGVNPSDDYEGSLETNRVIVYTLDFSMKVRFGGPVRSSGIILEVDVNYYDKLRENGLEPIYSEVIVPDSQ